MSVLRSILNLFRFGKNWKAVILCILAATIFWFFNALNKNYSANIDFPLVFEFDKEQFMPVQPLPEHVRVNVSGMGWDLFRKSIGLKVPPLTIPLENPAEVKKIVGSTLSPLFASQMDGLKINFVLTDTIQVAIDPLTERTLQVRIDSVNQYVHREFGLSGPVKIEPATVKVKGPRSLVKPLPDALRVRLDARNIEKPFAGEVEVPMPSNRIVPTPGLVKVSFPVDRLMDVTDTVSLRVINLPREVRPSILEKKITYTYRLPITRSYTIAPDSVRAVLDLAGIKKGNNKRVPRITGIPQFGTLIRVDTVEINY